MADEFVVLTPQTRLQPIIFTDHSPSKHSSVFIHFLALEKVSKPGVHLICPDWLESDMDRLHFDGSGLMKRKIGTSTKLLNVYSGNAQIFEGLCDEIAILPKLSRTEIRHMPLHYKRIIRMEYQN
ncbi:hypothetical protein EGR_10840 [Echinococcus granulosus]|uniref:Uncharacterized protein n=1 Tax=Echinococcus granulosus TaxID=6210 RepID=W6ULA7_ECHGR|nr:hypothetical protein EGR_10840 [Echinococcus granulosus]EUB54299.1 hypothetical protein EGR_10840 [Echinococcus granulosus]